MEATFFFDPACPFTWRTSRWLVDVAAARAVDVRWRAFSLSRLHPADISAQLRPVLAASDRALRLVEALRADHRDDDIGAFYREIGARSHEISSRLTDEIVMAAADSAGIVEPKLVLDDPAWDEAVRESHDEAVASAGPDIGSPVLLLSGAARGVYGPIIGELPDTTQALAVWDAVVALARNDAFFELKRGRR